jgi:hypothetical protein
MDATRAHVRLRSPYAASASRTRRVARGAPLDPNVGERHTSLAVRRTMPGLAVAVATTAAVAAMAPSAWATLPGLNGKLAYQSPGNAGSSLFAIQPLTGSLDDAMQPDSVPRLSKTVRVTPQRGIVFVRVRGAAAAVRLLESREIPVGSTINTRRGQALVEAATADERSTNSVIVSKGRAKVSQARRGPRAIVLRLPRLRCPSKRVNRLRTRTPRPTNTTLSARSGRLKPKKKVGTRTPGTNRALSARSCRRNSKKKKKVKVKGRYSIGSSCGTDWTTINTCSEAGTITIVRRGRVRVFDRVRGRAVTVRGGRRKRGGFRVIGVYSTGGTYGG